MKKKIEDIKERLNICHFCPGHPFCCGLDGITCIDCPIPLCKRVCRYCHPNDFLDRDDYSPENEDVTENIPCDNVIPFTLDLENFDYFINSEIPTKKCEILDLIMDLENIHTEKGTTDLFENFCIEFKKMAMSYIDYILLRRRADGEQYYDFCELCSNLGIKYNRNYLERALDPLLLSFVTKEEKKPSPTEPSPKETKNTEAGAVCQLPSLRFAEPKENDKEINIKETIFDYLPCLSPSYKKIFAHNLKELKKNFTKCSKTNVSQKTIIYFGKLIYDSHLVSQELKQSTSRRSFIKIFLESLGIDVPKNLKIENNVKVDLSLFPFFKEDYLNKICQKEQ